MNASPYFRYYAAFALILILVLLLHVQARPDSAVRPTAAAAASQLAASTRLK